MKTYYAFEWKEPDWCWAFWLLYILGLILLMQYDLKYFLFMGITILILLTFSIKIKTKKVRE